MKSNLYYDREAINSEYSILDNVPIADPAKDLSTLKIDQETFKIKNEGSEYKELKENNADSYRKTQMANLLNYINNNLHDDVYRMTTNFVKSFLIDILIVPWDYLTLETEISLGGRMPTPFRPRTDDYFRFKDSLTESERLFMWMYLDDIEEYYSMDKKTMSIRHHTGTIDNIKKLVEMLSPYFDVDESHYLTVAWGVIKKCATEVIGNQWDKEYDKYLTIAQCVEAYCLDDYIDKKSDKTIGGFTHYLMMRRLLTADFGKSYTTLVNMIDQENKKIELENFKKLLLQPQESDNLTYTIEDVDLMNGAEFEKFIVELFNKLGYTTVATKASHDQGIDVIAKNKRIKLGIQCKCYSSKVSNKAVQEVAAALKHYGCDKGLVVTNSYFTESAIELAESNNIILWNRDILKQKIIEIF